MIKFIVGLGNPGNEYANTRHNIGQLVIEKMISDKNLSTIKKFNGIFANVDNKILGFPLTYMNLSGEFVQKCAHFYKISPEEILVLHDELDISYGTMLLKKGGGLSGHNGLKSIKSQLQTDDFYRMRLGIGRPTHGGDVSSWVLSSFSTDQQLHLPVILSKVIEAIDSVYTKGWDQTSTLYNRKNLV